MADRQIGDLERILLRIDGRGYRAYRDAKGRFRFAEGLLCIDHVQGDPFATPSRIRVRIDQSKAKIPRSIFDTPVSRMALEDYLARRVDDRLRKRGHSNSGTGKSGLVSIDSGGQEVIERTALSVTENWVEARLEVGLPAAGRRVLGRQAVQLLTQYLRQLALDSLVFSPEFADRARAWVACIENQESMRRQLRDRGLVCFVADASVLPRSSGVSDRPLASNSLVAFQSPPSLRVSLKLAHPVAHPYKGETEISGMGIPAGVTLIIGGGYHGKSTLLRAIERGVYPHVPNDGREYVVTDPDTVKVRAEDRRGIEKVDISPFIRDLPDGQSTVQFSTEEASGSTSQAAAIVESMESEARVLLMDEDTSVTNFMMRDARMQRLVSKSNEPITPLVDRIREISESHQVSTMLVMGGSGDYLDVADTVLMMRNYEVSDETAAARRIAAAMPNARANESPEPFPTIRPRIPDARSVYPFTNRGRVRIDVPSIDSLRFGNETIDLRCLEQLTDRSQIRAVGWAIQFAARQFMGDDVSISRLLDELEKLMNTHGVASLSPFWRAGDNAPHPGNLARPRRHEIAAALNRLRSLRVSSGST